MANQAMQEYWNASAGAAWVEQQERLDRQLAALGALALQRTALSAGERVLDVGCGCGASTLEIAEAVGPDGRVVALDVSAPMLDRGRDRARASGLADRIEFLQGDAQTLELGEESFDCLYSRFGVMFFEDSLAAFRNLWRALRPGGRVVFACWQGREKNPWMILPAMAAAKHIEFPPPPDPLAPGPFAFADVDCVRGFLEDAGFEGVSFEGVEEPLTLGGGSVQEAVELFLAVGPVASVLREQVPPPEQRERVVAAVRDAMESFRGPEGLSAPSGAWIVAATRPQRAP